MLIGKLHTLAAARARHASAVQTLLWSVLALVFGAMCAAPPAAAAPPPPALSQAAAPSAILGVEPKLTGGEKEARFAITLSAEAPIRFETLAQPMRIVADLPEISFQAFPPLKAQGLVSSFRAGLVAPGRSRIVFDLARPARVSALRQQRLSDGIVEMQITFEAVAQGEFDKAAAEGAEERARAALAPLVPQPPPPGDRRPLVVIDPGHGGVDPGAVGAGGVLEKTIVLDIALKLRDELERVGQARVLMTRADDRFLSLAERVRLAREAQASLFVSLHADALSNAQDVRGATVYTASERASDAESARLAQKENAADAAGGVDTQDQREEVLDILNELARRETRAFSTIAAAKLVAEMSGAIRMHRIPQRAAGFRVLAAPDVPSVLIELGYLTSRNDAALLTSAEWQANAAGAIARAVHRAVSQRQSN